MSATMALLLQPFTGEGENEGVVVFINPVQVLSLRRGIHYD